jgi:hypothetical protein
MKRPVFDRHGELTSCIFSPLALSHNHKNVPCHIAYRYLHQSISTSHALSSLAT